MISAKICGITRYTDARLASNLGAEALGFIFYPPSPRYIEPSKAQFIIQRLGSDAQTVGVFVDTPPRDINHIAGDLGLDFVQLHGRESPEVCEQIDIPVIKAFRIQREFDFRILDDYNPVAYLFDTYRKQVPGGTGSSFNWNLLDGQRVSRPFLLAGGLEPANILQAVETANPAGVDVSSGVESTPGIKDEKKLKHLFSNIQSVNRRQESIFRSKQQPDSP